MRITLFCLLLNGSVVAQTAPSLTPTLPLPKNPTVQELVRVIPAQPTKAAELAKAVPTAAELPQWRGQDEGDSEFSVQIIKTQESWSRFWSRLNRPMPQALDESREMAVFIAVGERPTGGFKPRVVSATVRDGQFVVVYTDGKPSPETFVTQALTHPWVVAIVPKTSLPVVTQEQGAK
jgi:hypothetical protein